MFEEDRNENSRKEVDSVSNLFEKRSKIRSRKSKNNPEFWSVKSRPAEYNMHYEMYIYEKDQIDILKPLIKVCTCGIYQKVGKSSPS